MKFEWERVRERSFHKCQGAAVYWCYCYIFTVEDTVVVWRSSIIQSKERCSKTNVVMEIAGEENAIIPTSSWLLFNLSFHKSSSNRPLAQNFSLQEKRIAAIFKSTHLDSQIKKKKQCFCQMHCSQGDRDHKFHYHN